MNFRERDFSELFVFFSLLLFIFFIPISVSFAQIFLALSIFGYLYNVLKGKSKIKIPFNFILLSIFAIVTILSSLFSVDVKTSLKDLKEIVLFLIVPLFFNAVKKKEDIKIFNYGLSLAIFLSFVLSIFEYTGIILERERASGFLSHYMTQSGVMTLFSILSLCNSFSEKSMKKILWILLFLISIVSLTLTLTRSAWIGALLGITFVVILYRPKYLIYLFLFFLLIALLSPESVKKRFISAFDPKDETVKERIYMHKAGVRIMLKYPILGCGLDTAKIVYKKFKPPEAMRDVPHLHSNILQIGAELGIPALIVWLLFIYFSFVHNLKVWKFSKEKFIRFSALSGLGAIISLFIAGLFEFNFGDSEVKMLFLYLITYPFSIFEKEKEENKNGIRGKERDR